MPYASEHYQRTLTTHGIECSMSRRGDCWDNAPAESFFATLKKELVHHEVYETRTEARASLFEYIEVFDNRQRLHSSLGYQLEIRRQHAGIHLEAICQRPNQCFAERLFSCQDFRNRGFGNSGLAVQFYLRYPLGLHQVSQHVRI